MGDEHPAAGMPGPQERAARERTGHCRLARECCGRASTGSTRATPARRGSSACPGRRIRPRRRGGPRPTARRRARARRWTGSRAGRRRSDTKFAVIPTARAAGSARRRRNGLVAARVGSPASRWGRASAASSGVRTSSAATAGHQSTRPNKASPVASNDAQRLVPAPSTTSPRPSSPSPWRGGCRSVVQHGGQRVAHPQQHQPGRPRDGAAGGLGLGRGGQPELEDQAVILGGELPVQPGRGTCCCRSCSLERSQRAGPPARLTQGTMGTRRRRRAGRHPRRSRGCSPRNHLLGNAASQRWWCQDLVQSLRIVLEQPRSPGPAVQQPADPHPGQQPDAQLDAADPVHAAQRRVRRPP